MHDSTMGLFPWFTDARQNHAAVRTISINSLLRFLILGFQFKRLLGNEVVFLFFKKYNINTDTYICMSTHPYKHTYTSYS
jgi:hypothetical protein